MKNEHIELALDVKRGLKRFKDINENDRPHVVQAMRTLSDAQFATLALSKEKRQGRASLFTPKLPRQSKI